MFCIYKLNPEVKEGSSKGISENIYIFAPKNRSYQLLQSHLKIFIRNRMLETTVRNIHFGLFTSRNSMPELSTNRRSYSTFRWVTGKIIKAR